MGKKPYTKVMIGGRVPVECRDYLGGLVKSLGYKGQGDRPLWGEFFVAIWAGDIQISKRKPDKPIDN